MQHGNRNFFPLGLWLCEARRDEFVAVWAADLPFPDRAPPTLPLTAGSLPFADDQAATRMRVSPACGSAAHTGRVRGSVEHQARIGHQRSWFNIPVELAFAIRARAISVVADAGTFAGDNIIREERTVFLAGRDSTNGGLYPIRVNGVRG